MKQQNFSDIEYGMRKRMTKKEAFLTTIDKLLPWEEWADIIAPFYFRGGRGRPPRGIETMLRMYFLKRWFTLSDEMVEDSIYDSYAMRGFVGIDFTQEQVPDATTLLKFRHILERNGIDKQLNKSMCETLRKHGLAIRTGTLTDAALVRLPKKGKQKATEEASA